MMNCREATELCSDEMDRPLRLGEQVSLRTHLMMCTGCTEFRRHARTLRLAMRAYAEGQAATAESRPDEPV